MKPKETKFTDFQTIIIIETIHCQMFFTQTEQKSHFSGRPRIKCHVTTQLNVRFLQTWCQNIHKTSKKTVMNMCGGNRCDLSLCSEICQGGMSI